MECTDVLEESIGVWLGEGEYVVKGKAIPESLLISLRGL